MMAKSLDYWRGYFSGANSDICDIIENAVTVAALDHPEDLKLRRDRIAELLFTCHLTKCFSCDGVALSGVKNGSDGDEPVLEGEKLKSGEFEEEEEEEKEGGMRGQESEVKYCDDGHDINVSYEEAEELNDEIEKQSQLIQEVARIKGILDNPEAAESMLLDSLRRLSLMDISIENLKSTQIGKSVRGLKKHGSKKIQGLVRNLIRGWRTMLDSYLNATAAIASNRLESQMRLLEATDNRMSYKMTCAEDTPESIKISTIDSENVGLPSPPLDEGAFVPQSVELS